METREVAEGMTVRAVDGDKVGRVISCTDGWFVVQAGLLFSKEHFVRYDQVREIREGEVYLKVKDLDAASVKVQEPGSEAREEPRVPVGPSASGMGAGALGAAGLGTSNAPVGAGMSAGSEAVAGAGRPGELRAPRQASEDERTAVVGGSGRDPGT